MNLCPACGHLESKPCGAYDCPIDQDISLGWCQAMEAVVRFPFDPWIEPEDHYEAMCAMMAERSPA